MCKRGLVNLGPRRATLPLKKQPSISPPLSLSFCIPLSFSSPSLSFSPSLVQSPSLSSVSLSLFLPPFNYLMSSNWPSGGMKLMDRSDSYLLSLTHWWKVLSSMATPDLGLRPLLQDTETKPRTEVWIRAHTPCYKMYWVSHTTPVPLQLILRPHKVNFLFLDPRAGQNYIAGHELLKICVNSQ